MFESAEATDDDVAWPFPNGTTWNMNTTPLVLSSVSRLWREISLSSPALWTNIHVKLDQHPVASHKALDALTFSLNHAAAMPVSLSVMRNPMDPPGSIDPAVIARLTGILVNSKTSWKELELTEVGVNGDTLADSQTADFSSLESLALLSCPTGSQNVVRLVTAAPRLRSLQFDSCTDQLNMHTGRASQLTDLRLHTHMDAAAAVCVLEGFPSLEVCELNLPPLDWSDLEGLVPSSEQSSREPVVLVNLCSLSLMTSVHTSQFLDSITAPALERLLINDELDLAPFSARALSDFVARLGSMLGCLCLNFAQPDNLADLHLPKLTRLDIGTSRTLGFVFGVLARCPRLEAAGVFFQGGLALGDPLPLPIKLNHLVSLDFSCQGDTASWKAFFTLLNAPALSALHVYTMQSAFDAKDLTAFEECLEGTKCVVHPVVNRACAICGDDWYDLPMALAI